MREKAFSFRVMPRCLVSPPHLLPLPCTITRHGLALSQKDWICKHLQTNLMPPLYLEQTLYLLAFNHVCSCLLNHLAQLELQFHGNGILFKLGLLLFLTQAASVGWQSLRARWFDFIINQKQSEKNNLDVKEDLALSHCAPPFGVTTGEKGSVNKPRLKLSLSF